MWPKALSCLALNTTRYGEFITNHREWEYPVRILSIFHIMPLSRFPQIKNWSLIFVWFCIYVILVLRCDHWGKPYINVNLKLYLRRWDNQKFFLCLHYKLLQLPPITVPLHASLLFAVTHKLYSQLENNIYNSENLSDRGISFPSACMVRHSCADSS